MDRAKYNQCIRPYITGSKPKEQRRLDFCIGAKICSGKAKNVEEAKLICSQPKEPKPARTRKMKGGAKSCEKEVLELSQCMVEHIDMNLASNINSVGTAIANAMMVCRCPTPQ